MFLYYDITSLVGGEGGIRTHARQRRDRFSRAAPSTTRTPLPGYISNYTTLYQPYALQIVRQPHHSEVVIREF